MKFEDALARMRAGAHITHPIFDDEGDVYFIACKSGLPGMPKKKYWLSMVKMKGDAQHPDMLGGEFSEKPCKHGNHPQLNLNLIMSEDWQVWE